MELKMRSFSPMASSTWLNLLSLLEQAEPVLT